MWAALSEWLLNLLGGAAVLGALLLIVLFFIWIENLQRDRRELLWLREYSCKQGEELNKLRKRLGFPEGY